MEHNWIRPEVKLPGNNEMVVIKTYKDNESYFLAVYVGHRTTDVKKTTINELKKINKKFYDYDDITNTYWVPQGFYGYNPSGNPYKLKYDVEYWVGLPSMPIEEDQSDSTEEHSS